jgi:pimeloyl-ACP methyl ester carboxylesterase
MEPHITTHPVRSAGSGPDSIALHALTWGPPGCKPTLLLHGVQSAAATWWRIAAGLAAAGRRVVAPDLRGHGHSPPGPGYSLSDLAADVRALGGGWDLVIGHSLGGTLAAHLLEDPAFARRALLLDPVLHLPEERFEAIVASQLAELADPPTDPRWHPEDARLKAIAARQTTPAVNEAVLRENRPWAYEHLLDDVVMPVTILGSDPARGGMLDPATGEAIAARSPAVSYRRLEGVGHSAHRDAPALVLEAVT